MRAFVSWWTEKPVQWLIRNTWEGGLSFPFFSSLPYSFRLSSLSFLYPPYCAWPYILTKRLSYFFSLSFHYLRFKKSLFWEASWFNNQSPYSFVCVWITYSRTLIANFISGSVNSKFFILSIRYSKHWKIKFHSEAKVLITLSFGLYQTLRSVFRCLGQAGEPNLIWEKWLPTFQRAFLDFFREGFINVI